MLPRGGSCARQSQKRYAVLVLLVSAAVVSFASALHLPSVTGLESCQTDKSMNRRHFVGKTLLVGSSILATSTASSLPGNAQDPPQKLEFRTDESTGVMVADIRVVGTTTNNANGSGHPAVVVQPDSKVNIHITGRLLGKNGWIFENSQLEGEPYRLQLGQNAVVPGLELGLLGMAQGGKRRIVVPSEQGYLNKQLEPIPREFGNRQRLYTTVMNSVRVDRERTQLGSDLAGKVVFDVEVLRIR